jgi:hypothetical protein
MTSYRRAQRAVRGRLLPAGERLGRLLRRRRNIATKLCARFSRALHQYRQCRNDNRSLRPLSHHRSFLPQFRPDSSITAVAGCRLVTVFATGTLIYAFTIFGLGLSASAGLCRGDSILVSR